MTIQNILITTAIAVNIVFSTFLYLNSSYEYRNILSTIEKHSIHPLYGKYEQKLYHCYPWDSCKEEEDETKE